MRLVQISDTHVLAGDEVTAANAERVVAFVNEELRPDLVVHTGDVVGLSPDDDGDRRAAAAALAELRAPLLVVPGNHDIGSPGESPWAGFGVTSERIAQHARAFGEVPFLERVGHWGLIGLNSEAFGSGLPEEERQWEWLERTLASTPADSLALFLHRPLWNHRPTREPDENSVPAALRDRLLGLSGAERVRVVGNGHLHWYRHERRAELDEVWGPATGFVGPTYEDAAPPARCGVVEWHLDGDRVDTWFRAPATLDERGFLEIPEIASRIELLERRG
jgi:3',5'-cyclic AMP phosphodiesterase CpdA